MFTKGISGHPNGRPKGSSGGRAQTLAGLDRLIAMPENQEAILAALQQELRDNPAKPLHQAGTRASVLPVRTIRDAPKMPKRCYLQCASLETPSHNRFNSTRNLFLPHRITVPRSLSTSDFLLPDPPHSVHRCHSSLQPPVSSFHDPRLGRARLHPQGTRLVLRHVRPRTRPCGEGIRQLHLPQQRLAVLPARGMGRGPANAPGGRLRRQSLARP